MFPAESITEGPPTSSFRLATLPATGCAGNTTHAETNRNSSFTWFLIYRITTCCVYSALPTFNTAGYVPAATPCAGHITRFQPASPVACTLCPPTVSVTGPASFNRYTITTAFGSFGVVSGRSPYSRQ